MLLLCHAALDALLATRYTILKVSCSKLGKSLEMGVGHSPSCNRWQAYPVPPSMIREDLRHCLCISTPDSFIMNEFTKVIIYLFGNVYELFHLVPVTIC
jgi:hypothetical protein